MWGLKKRLNPRYISIPSNPNLYSNKIIMKTWLQPIANIISFRTISPNATPLPKAYDCVVVFIRPLHKSGRIWLSAEAANRNSLSNYITSDQKIAIHGNDCNIIFLIR